MTLGRALELGRGEAVWLRAIEPDLDRLHDDALVDRAIDHRRTRAEFSPRMPALVARKKGALA